MIYRKGDKIWAILLLIKRTISTNCYLGASGRKRGLAVRSDDLDFP